MYAHSNPLTYHNIVIMWEIVKGYVQQNKSPALACPCQNDMQPTHF
jgi:hypothetical protein